MMVAAPVSMMLRLIKTGRSRVPQEVYEAWAEHGRHETYPTLCGDKASLREGAAWRPG